MTSTLQLVALSKDERRTRARQASVKDADIETSKRRKRRETISHWRKVNGRPKRNVEEYPVNVEPKARSTTGRGGPTSWTNETAERERERERCIYRGIDREGEKG